MNRKSSCSSEASRPTSRSEYRRERRCQSHGRSRNARQNGVVSLATEAVGAAMRRLRVRGESKCDVSMVQLSWGHFCESSLPAASRRGMVGQGAVCRQPRRRWNGGGKAAPLPKTSFSTSVTRRVGRSTLLSTTIGRRPLAGTKKTRR